jgi:hypothetical protein
MPGGVFLLRGSEAEELVSELPPLCRVPGETNGMLGGWMDGGGQHLSTGFDKGSVKLSPGESEHAHP